MRRRLLRLLEFSAVLAAAIPVVRLEWWAAAISGPAVALAFAAERLARDA